MANIPQTSVSATQDVGMPGQLADLQSNADAVVDTGTSEEASANIAFGTFVKQGTADDGVLIPTATTDKLKGIVVMGHGFERNIELASTGLTPKTTFGVLRSGRAFVSPGADVTPASAVHVQVIANTGRVVGVVYPTGDTGKSIDISKLARFLTSGGPTSGQVAKLEIDIVNFALAAAD